MPRLNFDIGFFEHSEQRVGFYDQKNNKRSIHTRELMRLEIPPKIENSKQVAKQFVAAEHAPERRTVMHSRIQNRLIRARVNGITGFSAREIIREAATLMPEKKHKTKQFNIYLICWDLIRQKRFNYNHLSISG